MTDTTANNGGGSFKPPSRETFAAPRPRRFYEQAGVIDTEHGRTAVTLDGRTARTPGKKPLAAPTRALVEAMAAEWQAQGAEILAETMPLTRLANTALDGVTGKEAAVRDDIVAFSGSDLVCYRATAPEGLVDAQRREWDRILAWAVDALGVRFLTVDGIQHVAQPQAALDAVSRVLAPLDAWRLTALHQLTTLTGSALIALAHHDGGLSTDAAWRAAHVDEDWQISRWGEDHEARARRQQRLRDFQAASRLLQLLGTPSA